MDAGDDKSSIRPTKMCSLFTERHRGRNAAFFAPSDERKEAFGNAVRSEKNTRQSLLASGNSHGRIRGENAERTKLRAPFFSGEGLGDDVDGKTPGRGGACGSLRMGAPASRPVTFPRNAAEIRKTDELSAPG